MEDRAPAWYVYSRRLKGGHVYVGATNNLLRRESDALPLWVQRHGPEDGDQLLPLAYTHRHTALGLEDLWTARLMWALGVNRVRGGTHTRPGDYTLSDLESVSAFIRHNLQFSNVEVERRLTDELQRAPPQESVEGVLLCRQCKQARSFKGPLCPRCYYRENTCAKCGDKGHISKWCETRVLLYSPAGNPEQAVLPNDDGSEALINQILEAVDAAEAEYTAAEAARASKRRRESSEGASAPPSQSSQCTDCKQSAPACKPRCFSCWQKVSPCYYCGELGHMRRNCQRRHESAWAQSPLG